MVQSALLFALGFLVATLLGLLLAPVVWRRAQWIMRHRLEAVVPMTLDEVRADRDALRAEHAMAMRRLEVENQEIRAIDAEHLLEISRGQEALKARAAAIAARDGRIAELDETVRRLSQQIRAREKEIASLEVSHRVASREVAMRRERIATLSAALAEAESRADASAQMLIARDTTDAERSDELIAARREAGTMRQREATLRGALTDAQAELAEAGRERDRLEAELAAERDRADALSRDLAETDGMVRSELADLAAKVVRFHGSLGSETDLPTGDIAAKVATADPADDKAAPAERRLPVAAEPAFDDDLLAEMDAAAATELAPVAPAVDGARAGEPDRPPKHANDEPSMDRPADRPAHEERSRSQP